jgi:hypothetical protein
MFVSPLVAALLIGSFWTGIGTAAVVNHDGGLFDRTNRSDVVISATTSDHDSACSARYRSYDPSTGQFMGYDGHWHDCRL